MQTKKQDFQVNISKFFPVIQNLPHIQPENDLKSA